MFRKRRLEKSAAEPVTSPPLVPYGLIHGWLSNSRLVEVMNVTPHEVYSNILDVIPEWKRYMSSEEQRDTPKRQPDCSVCLQGFILLDATEATMTCSSCGVVHKHGLNIEREYSKPVEEVVSKEKNIRGVQQWVVDMTHSKPEKDYTSTFEHWNDYAHLPGDQLRLATHLLTRIKWSKQGNENARICALLLAPRLDILNEEDFRTNISKSRQLLETKITYGAIDPTPRPEEGKHVCADCGAHCFRRRDAMIHCKWKHNVSKMKSTKKY